MKKQKVFKQVAKHLLAQDKRCESVTAKGVNGCFYRHPEADLKCAVGCLITDEFYHEELEYKDVDDASVIAALEGSLKQPLTSSDRSLLYSLQHLHDYKDEWEKELDKLAILYFNKDLISMDII